MYTQLTHACALHAHAQVFIEKMENTIAEKVRKHEASLAREIFGAPLTASILTHVLAHKFARAASEAVASQPLSAPVVQQLIGHLVHEKFEQRGAGGGGDPYDALLSFLSGEQVSTHQPPSLAVTLSNAPCSLLSSSSRASRRGRWR